MANAGDKFIIELDSKMTHKGGFVYGVKGVQGLYFDDNVIRDLERRKDNKQKFDVGDEVNIVGRLAVVTNTVGDKYSAILEDGNIITFSDGGPLITRTGRNFPQIAEVLEEMRCEDE